MIYSDVSENRKTDHQKEINRILIETDNLNHIIGEKLIEDSPFGFLRKMYLNQEKLKTNQIFNQIYRYYTIFSDPILAKHIETKIGMPYYDFIICAFWLFSKFIESYHVQELYFFPDNMSIPVFRKDNISRVIDILSLPYQEIQKALKLEVTYDDDAFLFHGKQHIKTPIIRYNNHLLCLYKDVLLKQFTAGVYYTAEIFDKKHNLNNEFGQGFERYVGIILNQLNSNSKFTIRPEVKYEKGVNKTSDWIIENESEIVFVECKTKKQILETKLFSTSREYDDRLFQYAAQEISKIYKVFNDYQNGLISSIPYDSNKKFTPIIVFLEDGFYMDTDHKIPCMVKDILIQKRINPKLVDNYPFHIFSCYDFEYRVQIMFELGFSAYFQKLKSGELRQDYIENFTYTDYFSDKFTADFITPNAAQN